MATMDPCELKDEGEAKPGGFFDKILNSASL